MNKTQPLNLLDILPTIIVKIYQGIDNKQALLIADKAVADSLMTALPAIDWIHREPVSFNEQVFDKPYPLAVIVLPAEDSSTGMFVKSIQQCRDLFGRQCLVLSPIGNMQDLIALGFSRLSQEKWAFDTIDYELWQFNLFDYKQIPDWLNSKFWANPQNWDKFRW